MPADPSLPTAAARAHGAHLASHNCLSQLMFVYSHLAGRREFTLHDVEDALSGAELLIWKVLDAQPAGIPLVKTLQATVTAALVPPPLAGRRESKAKATQKAKLGSVGFKQGLHKEFASTEASRKVGKASKMGSSAKTIGGRSSAPGLYQFTHLSFQESLYVRALVHDVNAHTTVAQSNSSLAEFMNLPFNQNACRIAGGLLGRAFAAKHANWNFSQDEAKLTRVGRETLFLLTHHNTALKSLNLCSSNIGLESCEGLAKLSQTALSLHYLNLSNNRLGGTAALKETSSAGCSSAAAASPSQDVAGIPMRLSPSQSMKLAKIFQNSSLLSHLDVSSNLLGVDGAMAVSYALTNPCLRTLLISKNAIGDEGCAHLLSRLKQSSLTEIDVSFNLLSHQSGRQFSLLVGRQGSLVTLDLRGNDLGEAAGEALLSSIAGGNSPLAHIDGLSVEQLKAGRDEVLNGLESLGVHDGVIVGGLLSSNPSCCLRCVNLHSNCLRGAGVTHVLQGLPDADIEDLDLSFTALGSDGCVMIGKILTDRFAQLCHLSMAGNSCGDIGGHAISTVIRTSCCLRSCNLQNNCLTDDSGVAIASAILASSALTTIDLRGNDKLGEVTGKALLKAVGVCSTLEVVSGIFVGQLREVNQRLSPRGQHTAGTNVSQKLWLMGGATVITDLTEMSIGALEAFLYISTITTNDSARNILLFTPRLVNDACLRILVNNLCRQPVPSCLAFQAVGRNHDPTLLVGNDDAVCICDLEANARLHNVSSLGGTRICSPWQKGTIEDFADKLRFHKSLQHKDVCPQADCKAYHSSNCKACHSRLCAAGPARKPVSTGTRSVSAAVTISPQAPCPGSGSSAARIANTDNDEAEAAKVAKRKKASSITSSPPDDAVNAAAVEAAKDAQSKGERVLYLRMIGRLLKTITSATRSRSDARKQALHSLHASEARLKKAATARKEYEWGRERLVSEMQQVKGKIAVLEQEARQCVTEKELISSTYSERIAAMHAQERDGPWELSRDLHLPLLRDINARAALLTQPRAEHGRVLFTRSVNSSPLAIIGVSCTLCLCAIQMPAIMGSCSHVFCKLCISRWLKEHNICPECRKPTSLPEQAIVLLEEYCPDKFREECVQQRHKLIEERKRKLHELVTRDTLLRVQTEEANAKLATLEEDLHEASSTELQRLEEAERKERECLKQLQDNLPPMHYVFAAKGAMDAIDETEELRHLKQMIRALEQQTS